MAGSPQFGGCRLVVVLDEAWTYAFSESQFQALLFVRVLGPAGEVGDPAVDILGKVFRPKVFVY